METSNRLASEPRGKAYRELVDWASSLGATGVLIRRLDLELSRRGHHLLALLEPSVISRTRGQEWPGTSLLDGEAEITQFRLDSNALEVLNREATGLFDWCQPELPEDLCFLRQDGEPLLVSISHEKEAYLSLRGAELEHLRSAAPEVASLQRK